MPRDVITLDDVTPNNIGVLKKINEVTLPVEFTEDWYQEALRANQIVKLGYYVELPVGAIKGKAINRGHLDYIFNGTGKHQGVKNSIPNAVYIESIAVLEGYRNLGIGSRLLDYLTEETRRRFIHEIVLHVKEDNTQARQWYKKRGFQEHEEVVKGYYKEQGLANDSAVILSKKI